MVYFLINPFINFNKISKSNLIFIFRANLQIYFYVCMFEYEICTSRNLKLKQTYSRYSFFYFSDMKIFENL